jgi:hypothetical protein
MNQKFSSLGLLLDPFCFILFRLTLNTNLVELLCLNMFSFSWERGLGLRLGDHVIVKGLLQHFHF